MTDKMALQPTEVSQNYTALLQRLSEAYDGHAAERDARPRSGWKVELREAFLHRLQAEGKQRLVELGAGPGHDSLFFHEAGLSVTAIDPSPEMVRLCRAKGIDAHQGDFLNPGLPPGSADAVWSMNSLLHVPNADLLAALQSVRELLRPGGLFALCVYGGEDEEGLSPNDQHQPARFFSFRSDDRLRTAVETWFHIVDFTIVNDGTTDRSQALTLRRRDSTPGEAP